MNDWWKTKHCYFTREEIRSMECASAQCVAFPMPKQVVTYWGRNLQRCKQSVPAIWRGSQNCKSTSRDPITTPFDLILHFFIRSPQWPICVPNLKFLPSTVSEICRGSKNSKRRSRYSFMTLLTLFCRMDNEFSPHLSRIFFCIQKGLQLQNLYREGCAMDPSW